MSGSVVDGETIRESPNDSDGIGVKFKSCSLPPLRCMLVHEKGAFVILVWSFALFSVFHFIIKVHVSDHNRYFLWASTTATILFPIAGFMADVYIGRYKIVQCSMRLTWIAVMAYGVVSVLPKTVPKHVSDGLMTGFTFFMIVGLTGFHSNIVQFTMDQFHDASSRTIKAYIYLYYWTFCASRVLVLLTQVCTFSRYNRLIRLLLPILLTVALCSDFLFHHLLVKEPVTRNPLKLIFQVLRYAAKNKYPRLRSAFTYWDDKPYSRIDLAKAKYGGPFSTEQVEDVKTFFRIVVVMGIASLFTGMLIHGDNIISSKRTLSLNHTTTEHVSHFLCYRRLLFSNAGEILITLLIPLYRYFIGPFLSGYIRFSILKKCGVGLIAILICAYTLLFFQLGEQLKNEQKSASSCSPLFNTDIVDQPWMICFSLLASVGEFLLFVSCLEFVCAQTPYSMKGLLLGFLYLGFGFSLFSIFSIGLLFKKIGTYHLPMNCEFWYILVSCVIATVLFVAFVVASIWYKKRQRDDNLPSQHYFAEEYYGNLVQSAGDEN